MIHKKTPNLERPTHNRQAKVRALPGPPFISIANGVRPYI